MDKLVKKLNSMIEECQKKDGVIYLQRDVSAILARLWLDVVVIDGLELTARNLEIMAVSVDAMPSTLKWSNCDLIRIYESILDLVTKAEERTLFNICLKHSGKGLIFDESQSANSRNGQESHEHGDSKTAG